MNILVSACLLGINCKYSGGNNYSKETVELKHKYNLIPICPEQLGGLHTPREPVEIVKENNDKKALTKTGCNVTTEFIKGAQESLKLAEIFDCTIAVLKEKSPSCGCGVVYDGTFSHIKTEGNGYTAQMLIDNGIKVIGESKIPTTF